MALIRNRKPETGNILPLLCVLCGALSARAKECADCHSGQEKNVAVAKLPEKSAHAKQECGECHTGLKVNEEAAAAGQKVHGDKIRPVQCKTCHADEAKALGESSHGEKLKLYFEKKEGARPAAMCQACHSGDIHVLPPVKDSQAPTARSTVPATCLACHTEKQPMDISDYKSSVHGQAVAAGNTKAAVCTDCHGTHAISHSRLPQSLAFYGMIPKTCEKCHADEAQQYTNSIHWAAARRGFRESPVCTDCHGEHAIRSRRDPLAPTFAGNVTRTCSACHASERIAAKFSLKLDRATSFKESFHGLSGELGNMHAANCASCHGNHEILPASDPNSTINPANLGHTCGRCHPGAEKRFITERVHISAEVPSHWIVSLVRTIYIWLIVLTIGGMLIHDLLDLKYKSMKGIPYHRLPGLTPRFSVNERVQHGLLALSFIFLALSGFALRFPSSPLAWPFQFQSFAGAADLRRWVHRVCAGVFVLLALYHIFYLLLCARGRAQLNALRPVPQDVKDARNVLLKYLGRYAGSLRLPHYAYTEKMEYWALVWGGIVMTLTGFVLLFINLSLSSLALWAVDLARTIHSWEALLACLAILVWHFYWVFFDPEIYPISLTWLIGNPRPGKDSHEKAQETQK